VTLKSIPVATIHGIREVEAFTDPAAELVVTPAQMRIADEAMWAVTHRRTGMAVVRLPTVEAATSAVAGLLPLASWSEVRGDTGLAAPDERKAVYTYLRGLVGARGGARVIQAMTEATEAKTHQNGSRAAAESAIRGHARSKTT